MMMDRLILQTLSMINFLSLIRELGLFSQRNSGLSAARNVGLLNARGSFLMFMDSDDFFLKSDMIELCIEKIMHEKSELLIFGFELFYSRKDTKIRHVTSDVNGMYSSVWNKVYSKNLIEKLEFPVSKYYEDMGFVLRCALRATKVSVIDQPFYAYVQRSGSIASTNGRYLQHIDIIDVLKPVFSSEEYLEASTKLKHEVEMFTNYQIINTYNCDVL
ncbi:glycosyltransferase [Loigolactobacillus bifermentans]|nr:glycosyltransferase [Loigolactobacillus bifermentans]